MEDFSPLGTRYLEEGGGKAKIYKYVNIYLQQQKRRGGREQKTERIIGGAEKGRKEGTPGE